MNHKKNCERLRTFKENYKKKLSADISARNITIIIYETHKRKQD